MTRIVTLTGVSLKGKNRVREHGDRWRVTREHDGKLLIEPVAQRNPARPEMRWVRVHRDPNFTIS